MATGRPPAVVERQSAIVAQAHVAARVEDAVDAAFVADGAFAAGPTSRLLAIEAVRQRFHVGSCAGRQNGHRLLLLLLLLLLHVSRWDGLVDWLRLYQLVLMHVLLLLLLLRTWWAHTRRGLVNDGRLFGRR